jgi:hypothetical protein
MNQLENEIYKIQRSVEILKNYLNDMEDALREVKMWRQRYLGLQHLPDEINRGAYTYKSFMQSTCKEMFEVKPEVLFEKFKSESHRLFAENSSTYKEKIPDPQVKLKTSLFYNLGDPNDAKEP